MNLIITRNFPPDVGGMQNLMFGLTKSLSEHMMIKVFADEHYQQDKFDEDLSFSIERVGGPKIFRKFRKASLINNYLQKNTMQFVLQTSLATTKTLSSITEEE